MEQTDIIIVGQGPAGFPQPFTARAGMDTLILGCAPKVAGDYDSTIILGSNHQRSGDGSRSGASLRFRPGFNANAFCPSTG